jgi:hypothetical protein
LRIGAGSAPDRRDEHGERVEIDADRAHPGRAGLDQRGPRSAERIDDRRGAARRRGPDQLDQQAGGRRVQPRRVAVERVGQRLGDIVIDVRRPQRGDQRLGAVAHAIGEHPAGRARHRQSAALAGWHARTLARPSSTARW